MEKIFRIDTDDQERINKFVKLLNDSKGNIVIPQGDHIKLWVIDNEGKAQELK